MSAMVPRLIGWLGLLVLIPVLLWLTLVKVPQAARDLQAARQNAEQERQRLVVTLTDLDGQFTREQERYARILQRFPWLTEPSEGTAFLTRLGNIVTGLSLKVMGIGAMQREASGRVEKLGRQVRVAGRFADSLRLVENVEQHKGFVEELKIQRPQSRGAEGEGVEEIEAQFRLSSVELSPDIRESMRALVSALPDAPQSEPVAPDGAPLLLVPAKADPRASVRDPFMIPVASRRRGPQAEAIARPAEPAFPDFMLAGIIVSTTGRTAIINKRIVKEGERVTDGILVETISTTEVVLRAPFGTKRLILPKFERISEGP